MLHTLEALKTGRLLGKGTRELAACVLLAQGGFRADGSLEGDAARVLRFVTPHAVLCAALDDNQTIEWLHLALIDPDRAALCDSPFALTAVADDGHHAPIEYPTALSLTFLREALGCPLTQAATLYAKLLGGAPQVDWGGATVAFDSEPKHGLKVRRAPSGGLR